MDTRISRTALPTADVYTDVQGLQSLKTEKDQEVALKKIAQQFESLFLQEMLKSMRKANEVFEEDSLFNGGDTQFFRDMYDQQLSLNLAQKGTGLAQSIYQQLSRQYGQANPETQNGTAEEAGFDLERRRVVPERSAPMLQREMEIAPARAPKITAPAAKDSVPVEAPTESFGNAKDFIEAVLPHAQTAANLLGLNPLFLAAQAALETGWGKYVIRDKAGESTHNLFNIKADRAWQGEKAEVSTLEYRGGIPVREQAQFRKYADMTESFADYVRFLQSNPRYQDALAVAGDDRQFALGLQKAGYATDPNYAKKILAIVEQISNGAPLAGASF